MTMSARETSREGEVLKGVKAQKGQKFATFEITCAADPQAVNFAALGLPNMKDTAYRVLLHEETLTVAVDYSTKAKTGFNIINGTGAEVAVCLIHGNVDE